jgi:hypothetical protein
MDYLSRGSGVFDIAGGKGHLGIELCLNRNIPCSVVDPIGVKFSEHTSVRILNLARSLNQRKEITSNSDGSPLTVLSPAIDSDTIEKETSRTNRTQRIDPLINTSQQIDETSVATQQVLLTAKTPHLQFSSSEMISVANTAKMLDDARHFLDEIGFKSYPFEFNANFCSAVEIQTVWRQASVVVGMHPDQATEAIVDEALKCGKPFAVVPCCVFPKLFPHRTTPDKNLVMTLDQFILYLMAKHSDIKIHVLEIVFGSYVVLYKL